MPKLSYLFLLFCLNAFVLSAQTTDLSIAIEAQDLGGNPVSQVDIFEDFQYVITILNSGNSVNDASFSVDFDEDLTIISTTSQNNSNGASNISVVDLTDNVLTANIASMPNNSSVELLVLVTAPPTLGGIAANGIVSPPDGTTDVNSNNNQSIISIDVLDIVIDFVVTHTQIQPSPGTAINMWGDEVTYQFTITNNSEIDFPLSFIEGKLILQSDFDNGQPFAEFISMECLSGTNGTSCPDLSNIQGTSAAITTPNLSTAPSLFLFDDEIVFTEGGSLTFQLVYRFTNFSCSPDPATIEVASAIEIGLNHANVSPNNSNFVDTILLEADPCAETDICIETEVIDPITATFAYNENITLETTVCNNGPSAAPIRFFLQNLSVLTWDIISINCLGTTGAVTCNDFTLTDNGQIWVSSDFVLEPNTTITIETVLQFIEPDCVLSPEVIQALVRSGTNIIDSQIVDTNIANNFFSNILLFPPAEQCDIQDLSDIQVEKTQISPAIPIGETPQNTAEWGEIVYEIVVTNDGDTDEFIELQDYMPVPGANSVPIEATLISVECTGTTGGASCSDIVNANIGVTFDGITDDGTFDTFWQITPEENWLLPANSSVTFTVVIDWQPECALTPIVGTNIVRVDFVSGIPEPITTNNSAEVNTFFAPCIDLVVQTFPELTQIDTGQSFNWIVDISNSATSSNAIDILFENFLNPVFTINGVPSCTVTSGNATCISTFEVDGNTISGIIPTMDAGSTISISIPVTAPIFGGAFNNTAQAFPSASDNEEITPETNISINSIQVIAPVLDKFFLPTSIFEGNESELVFTVFNVANSPLQNNISFTDNLPQGLFLVSEPDWVESNGCTTNFIGNIGDDFVGVNDLIFPEGVDSCTFSVIVTSNIGGTYLNNFENFTNTNNIDVSQTSATLDVLVDTSDVDIEVLKSVEPTEAIVGEQVTFTITAVNNGTTEGTAIEISDQLPDGYEFVSAATSLGTFNETDLVWSIPVLNPEASATLDLTVNLVSAIDLLNIASLINLNETDRNPSNNEDDASVDVSNCLLVPQGISPNGDRENDVLVIPCIESYPDNVLKIFNRNGTQIYEASNYLNTWDGRANMGFPESSRRLPVGTYFYVLQINGFENPIGGYIYLNY
ncbi:DUF7933 domain-containing protein [Winogradskyella tangerina]|uniref:DUF7933 domain-containing protein n=1 Tax=Winogradskyella tangerina TaxID=2023240 RepID=UPI000DBE5EEB|nr:gliding motility-associated C-terminal domain-containing protein [Winogradskyella tangerina]